MSMYNLVMILDAALNANLSKRQWAVVAAVLQQTLGYRRSVHDLSAVRLAQLTGIQRNHIWQAKQELVEMGVLISAPGHYGERLGFKVLQNKNSASSPPSKAAHPEQKSPVAVPDLGATDSQFRPQTDSRIGPEAVPKQDTILSKPIVSNHNSYATAESSPQKIDAENPPPPPCPTTADTALEWPPGLAACLRHEITGLLCGLESTTAQSVLDILAMGLEAGSVRKPVGYVRTLVQSARKGELVTAEAQAWRQQRQQQHRQALKVQAQVQARERAGEQAWLQQMAHLRGLSVEQMAAQLEVKSRSQARPANDLTQLLANLCAR